MNPRSAWACIPVLAAPALGASAPQAQPAADAEPIDVRAMVSSPGTLVVDRGAVDHVEVGDVATFELKDGTTKRGAVTKVDERSSTVKLDDKSAVVPVGARRRHPPPKPRRNPPKKAPPAAEPAKPAPVPPVKPAGGAPTPPDAKAKPAADAKPAAEDQSAAPGAPTSDHPAWTNTDKGWTKGMPLLTELPPVRPDQRTPTFSGHAESEAQYVRSAGGSSSDSYIRAGGDLTAENLFGDGSTVHVAGDVYHRAEVDGGNGIGVLPYEASVTWGGTRFDAWRLEAGRFLQYGVPQFGVLDGAECTRRLADGNSIGASVGWMPEPDDDFGSFHDFQVAAYYHWTHDDSERFAATAGFEKTFHDWRRDRDLFVADGRAPLGLATDFHGTAWVDFYDSGDNRKSAVELTQAFLELSHRFGDDAEADLTLRHQKFPQIDRQGEFTPVAPADLEHDHLDEISASAWQYLQSHVRLHGQLGAWLDQDEKGGSADAGIEFPEVLIRDLKTDFTLIGSRGDFTTILGGRVTCSLAVDGGGQWDAVYEYANHRLHGAPSDQNDLAQQQLFLDRSFRWGRGWLLSLNASATWWDTDITWSVGWFVQKSF